MFNCIDMSLLGFTMERFGLSAVSNSHPIFFFQILNAPVAEWLRHSTCNPRIPGSNPHRPSNKLSLFLLVCGHAGIKSPLHLPLFSSPIQPGPWHQWILVLVSRWANTLPARKPQAHNWNTHTHTHTHIRTHTHTQSTQPAGTFANGPSIDPISP